MMHYKACQMAQEMLQQAKAEMAQGAVPTVEEMAEIVHMHEFCKLVQMDDFWRDYWAQYGNAGQQAHMHPAHTLTGPAVQTPAQSLTR